MYIYFTLNLIIFRINSILIKYIHISLSADIEISYFKRFNFFIIRWINRWRDCNVLLSVKGVYEIYLVAWAILIYRVLRSWRSLETIVGFANFIGHICLACFSGRAGMSGHLEGGQQPLLSRPSASRPRVQQRGSIPMLRVREGWPDGAR